MSQLRTSLRKVDRGDVIKQTHHLVDLGSNDDNDGTIELDLDNTWNYSYIATLYLGTPAQPVRALFDTGSANAWVIGQEAVDKLIYPNKFQAYDVTQSSTAVQPAFKDRDYAFITFGSGSLKGYFIKDVCSFGDPDN